MTATPEVIESRIQSQIGMYCAGRIILLLKRGQLTPDELAAALHAAVRADVGAALDRTLLRGVNSGWLQEIDGGALRLSPTSQPGPDADGTP